MREASNILIVDGTPDDLPWLTELLQEQGYTVRLATSDTIDEHALVAQVPDLILLDIRGPGAEGYTACQRLNTAQSLRKIPIILILTPKEIEDIRQVFHAGAVDYITQPLITEEVLARIHTQIQLAHQQQTLSDTKTQLQTMVEQLVLAEKLKSLGIMAAGVAHELNTPIGNAILTASAIDDAIHNFTQQPEQDHSHLEWIDFFETCRDGSKIILRNLERASGLISALKEVSVDRSSERRRRINLLDTAANVVGLMNATLKKTPHVVMLDIDIDLTLETYPGHLEQILENLIQNALTHGLHRDKAGTIRLTAQKPQDGLITLTVIDDGQGIPPRHLNRIFDPFFTTRLGQGGSGLGLHIVYNLVTGLLGGSISVSSTPGKGTQFTLCLPLVAPLEPDADESAD